MKNSAVLMHNTIPQLDLTFFLPCTTKVGSKAGIHQSSLQNILVANKIIL